LRIDRRLNLIVPIYGEEVPRRDASGAIVMADGEPVMDQPVIAHVHSIPLSTDVVDRYFMILGQTYTTIFTQGLGIVGGPPFAMRILKMLATQQKIWEDDPQSGLVGVKHGVIDEMIRLTTVAVPEGNGWMGVPLDIAVGRNFITAEDKAEVENAIVFFIVGSATLPLAQRKAVLIAAANASGAQISPLSFTEFTDSLKTSTGIVSSGEKSPAPAPAAPGPANAMVDGKPVSVPV